MEEFTIPTHFTIIALETFFTPLPPLSLPSPHTFSLTTHHRTPIPEIPSRIKDADILITTTLPLRAENLSATICPKLKLIAVLAAGTDSIDLEICKQRGIRVVSSPDCNSDAVAEHAVAMYFAVRRAVVPTMVGLREGRWAKEGSLMEMTFQDEKAPRSCRDEVVVVVGYGAVGKRVARLCKALGMRVEMAARKGRSGSEGRVLFEDALKMASVVVLCCPRTPETVGLFSDGEFGMMMKDAFLVNVSRGGIVDESSLLKALKSGQIAGAGVDVFEKEPASPETSCLLGDDARGLNLVVTPHTAWIGQDTTANYQRVLQENLNGFINGKLLPDRVKA